MKVLVLHAYSALNAGDGLLVEATIKLLREAFPEGVEISVAASHPDTFSGLGLHDVYDSSINLRGYNQRYRQALTGMNQFSLVVGVGGGYLRAGNPVEAAKTMLVHGPQLLAAARSQVPSIYLSQSIGPFLPGIGSAARRLLSRIDKVIVRDDRSQSFLNLSNVERLPDLAILDEADLHFDRTLSEDTPIVTVRAVRGEVPPLVRELCQSIGGFEGYVQSETAGNNDIEAVNSIGPQRIITRESLLHHSGSRVVVAVRLHAALMALRAGHYVIHLAYERKGFGAFDDLGLGEFVHNVNKFEPERVIRQIDRLTKDDAYRDTYARHVVSAFSAAREKRKTVVSAIRSMVGIGV